MKAIQVQTPASLESLTLVDRPDPSVPGPEEVQVRIFASSLNYHDYAVVTGALPTADGRIPLSDGAGEVIAVGSAVTDYEIGDQVVSTFFPYWLDGPTPRSALGRVPGDSIDGYACEKVNAPSHAFTRSPNGYSHAEAATLTCAGLTAWRALIVDGALKPGATVLVQGTGGVSIFALQFAKAMGATVIATSSSSKKLEKLLALGADHVINYKEVPQWGRAVLELTKGQGVDHVVEVGGAGILDQSMLAARNGGHIALIGVLAGYAGPVKTALLMSKQLRVQGLTVGSRKQQLDMISAINQLGIKPVLDSHFALGDLASAFRYQESGAHFGKIVISLDPEKP
jgi:NADPH:quinone reductase-like Zn-dependent oxidoreductase